LFKGNFVENNKKSKFNFQYKNFKNIKYIGEKNPNLKSTIIWEKGKRSKSLNSLKILNNYFIGITISNSFITRQIRNIYWSNYPFSPIISCW